MIFAEELKKVAASIDAIITHDDFPDTIEPDFLRDAVIDYPARGGKRLRPALLLWCCGAVGGDPQKAMAAAAAVEIFHNWTLVHDDIIDDDDFRRGQPTTHARLRDLAIERYAATALPAEKFGRDFAILTGDLQQAWANRMLLRSLEHGLEPRLILMLCRRMQDMVNRELISGEALDVEFPWIGPEKLAVENINRMLYLKTGVLLRYCAETGAIIGLGDIDGHHEQIRWLGEFAAAAGIAFQYRDDWLGIFGNEKEFGKPVGSDLAEAKPTVLLVTALNRLNESGRRELLGCLRRPEYPPELLEQVRQLLRESGAEELVLTEARRLTVEAAAKLNRLPDSPYRRLLHGLLEYLIDRHR